MELRTYIEIVWRRKWVIAIAAAVTVLVTAAGTFLMAPTYEASATLRVAPGGGLASTYTELTYATQLKNTLIRLATSDRVLSELTQRLGLNEPPKVEMELLGNSELMLVTVQHPDPQVAQDAANTMAEILIDLNKELYVEYLVTYEETLDAQLAEAEDEWNQAWENYQATIADFPDDTARVQASGRAWELTQQRYNTLLQQREEAQIQETLRANALSVFELAKFPKTPAGLPKVLFIAVGLVVGLTAGTGLAFLFENLDTTLHTAEQIQASTQLVPLARIPAAAKQHAMIFSNGRSPHGEAYRRLRTNLFALGASSPLQAMLVASAEPGEGKTTVLANLASTIAEASRRVVVVDCDLRLGRLHQVFQIPNGEGLATALQEEEPELDCLLHDTGIENLWAITSGPSPEKPTELLDSRAMTDLLEKLRERFDVILLDTPPMSAVADAAILAPLVDGVLLVVSCGKSRQEEVHTANQQLADVGARLAGIVVNRTQASGDYYYYQPRQHRTGAEALRQKIAQVRHKLKARHPREQNDS